MFDKPSNSSIKKAQRKIKKLEAKIKKKDKKLKATKRNQATKFNKRNPGAYIPAAEWHKLSPEEKVAARKARQAQGIPVRKIGSMGGLKRGDDQDVAMEDAIADGVANMGLDCDAEEEDCEESSEPATTATLGSLKQSPPKVAQGLLVAPPTRSIATTQREKFYLKRLDKKSKQREDVAWGVIEEEKKNERRNIKSHR